MNTNADFDRTAAAWLADGPTELNDRVLEAALDEVHLTSQRRRSAMPWRTSSMPNYLRLAAGVALVAILGAGGLLLINRPPSIGVPSAPPATASPAPPSPSAAPSSGAAATQAPIDTTGWTTYRSKQYGIELAHPADWTVDAATRAWTVADDAVIDILSPAMDSFTAPDRQVRVSFWVLPGGLTPVASGASSPPAQDFEAFAREFCLLTANSPCDGIHARAVALCLEYRDCHPALLVPYQNEIQAYFPDGAGSSSVVVAVIWRADGAPSTLAYGGSRLLLERFLSTFDGGGANGVWPKGYLPPVAGK